jgi:ABC-type sulfate transport system permease component
MLVTIFIPEVIDVMTTDQAIEASRTSPAVAGAAASIAALLAVITAIVVISLVRRRRKLKKKHGDALVL